MPLSSNTPADIDDDNSQREVSISGTLANTPQNQHLDNNHDQFLIAKDSDMETKNKTQVLHTGSGSQFLNSGTGSQVAHTGRGDLYTATSMVFEFNDSLFKSLLFDGPVIDDPDNEVMEMRDRFLAGRRPPHPSKQLCGYAPYVEVTNSDLKPILRNISEQFQFLDNGFAEYFRVVGKSFGENWVKRKLKESRQTLTKSQFRNPQVDHGREEVYLGHLGSYCEDVVRSWSPGNNAKPPQFTVWHENDQQKFSYLQYAMEVPYWKLMLRAFARKHGNSMDLTRQSIFRVLESVKLEVLVEKRRLVDKLNELKGDDTEDLEPIIRGIDARIEALEGVEGSLTFHNSILQSRARPNSPATNDEKRAQGDDSTQRNETAVLIALVLIFLAGAIVTGYKAFAISMQEGAIGSTNDADFWSLIQSSIMAVMGNIVMVLPLLRKSWFSPAYSFMWFFFTLGLVCAATSIALYPVCNKGWSSMVSFLGSVMSAASVLVMTQTTAREVARETDESGAKDGTKDKTKLD